MEVFYGRDILLLAPLLLICMIQLLWLFFPYHKLIRKEPSQKLTDVVFCLCIALTVGTLLRQYPWTTLPTQTDSSVFLYIGKQMHAGKVPYVDLFDHKGPALYFIQYLGFAIWPGSIRGGVWLLEVISFGLLSWLMVKVSEFATNDHRNSYLAVILLLVACAFKLYQGGNYTEEHVMLWITLSAYIFYSFFRTGRYSRLQIAVLGFSCMVVLLMQGNLITVWVAFIPLVLIRLLREKRYSEILSCILLFVGGMALAFLPVLFWALRCNCLKEMWQDYILFNFTYSENMAPGFWGYLDLTRKTLTRLWPGVLAMLVSLAVDRKNKIQWLNLWFFAVSVVLMQVSGRDSLYYLLVILPALAVPAAGFFDALQRLYRKSGVTSRGGVIVILTCLMMTAAAVGHREISSRRERYDDGVVPYLLENTNKDDDVLIVGNYAWPYLAADRTTENRFFFQWPPIRISDELYQEFLSELDVHPSDVIILAEYENSQLKIPGEGKIYDTLEMLEEQGYQKEQYEGFRVYRAPSQ